METIKHESQFLLLSICMGIGILFVYDFFRIFRRIVPHKKGVIFFEDYFFWLFSGFGVFLLTYEVNSGAVRGFSLVGVAIGMLGYHLGPSHYVVKGISFFPEKIISWFRKKRKTSRKTQSFIEKNRQK